MDDGKCVEITCDDGHTIVDGKCTKACSPGCSNCTGITDFDTCFKLTLCKDDDNKKVCTIDPSA